MSALPASLLEAVRFLRVFGTVSGSSTVSDSGTSSIGSSFSDSGTTGRAGFAVRLRPVVAAFPVSFPVVTTLELSTMLEADPALVFRALDFSAVVPSFKSPSSLGVDRGLLASSKALTPNFRL